MGKPRVHREDPMLDTLQAMHDLPNVPPAADTTSTELPRKGEPSTTSPMLIEADSIRSLMSCKGGLSGSPLSRWAVLLAAHLCLARNAASVSSPAVHCSCEELHLHVPCVKLSKGDGVWEVLSGCSLSRWAGLLATHVYSVHRTLLVFLDHPHALHAAHRTDWCYIYSYMHL